MNKTTLLTLILLSSPLLAQQAPQGKPPAMSEMFMRQLDADKDGKVTKAEFVKPHEAQFAQMDMNGDGSIDKAEIEAFDEKMRQRMQQFKQQQSGK